MPTKAHFTALSDKKLAAIRQDQVVWVEPSRLGCMLWLRSQGMHHEMERFYREQHAAGGPIGPDGPGWPRENLEAENGHGLNMVPPFLNGVTRNGALEGPGGLLFPKPTLVRAKPTSSRKTSGPLCIRSPRPPSPERYLGHCRAGELPGHIPRGKPGELYAIALPRTPKAARSLGHCRAGEQPGHIPGGKQEELYAIALPRTP